MHTQYNYYVTKGSYTMSLKCSKCKQYYYIKYQLSHSYNNLLNKRILLFKHLAF